MTNYEKICAIINAGHYAVCEYDGIKEKFTDITEDGKLCFYRGRCDEFRANRQKFTRIYPLPRPIPKYKIGDKVVVLENIKELEVGEYFTVGEVCEVTNNKPIEGTICIKSENNNSIYYPTPHRVLPHCVAPYFEDEVEEMTVEQVCKALGKNIKIVK